MKAIYQLNELPGNGVMVTVEGTVVRLLFDFEKHVSPEEEDAPVDLYDCESVDVRSGRSYGDIVSAIVGDRYPYDKAQAVMANHEYANDSESGLDESKRQEYLAEYSAYQDWRKHAKEIAKKVLDVIG